MKNQMNLPAYVFTGYPYDLIQTEHRKVVEDICNQIFQKVGTEATFGMQSYFIGGEPVIAFDIGGNGNLVSLTMFCGEAPYLPVPPAFDLGRVSGNDHDIELTFSIGSQLDAFLFLSCLMRASTGCLDPQPHTANRFMEKSSHARNEL